MTTNILMSDDTQVPSHSHVTDTESSGDETALYGRESGSRASEVLTHSVVGYVTTHPSLLRETWEELRSFLRLPGSATAEWKRRYTVEGWFSDHLTDGANLSLALFQVVQYFGPISAQVQQFLQEHEHVWSVLPEIYRAVEALSGIQIKDRGLTFIPESPEEPSCLVVDFVVDMTPKECALATRELQRNWWLDQPYEVRRDICILVLPE